MRLAIVWVVITIVILEILRYFRKLGRVVEDVAELKERVET